MTSNHTTLDRAADVLASRSDSEDCWTTLPGVIRAVFECSQHVSVQDALQALGANNNAHDALGINIARAYESTRGPLVVTVWHDQIEREIQGALACWIDGFGWRPDGEGPQGDRNEETRRLLSKHVGSDVYVLLLKRGWDVNGAPVLESSAPDIVMWKLAVAGQEWFVLRRPSVKRSDPKRGN